MRAFRPPEAAVRLPLEGVRAVSRVSIRRSKNLTRTCTFDPIHTGPNPRYFARGRGVTWLNYMSDQFAGLHAIVVPGTLRDSLVILDGLLELQPLAMAARR